MSEITEAMMQQLLTFSRGVDLEKRLKYLQKLNVSSIEKGKSIDISFTIEDPTALAYFLVRTKYDEEQGIQALLRIPGTKLSKLQLDGKDIK